MPASDPPNAAQAQDPEPKTPLPQRVRGWAGAHPLGALALLLGVVGLAVGGFFFLRYESSFESTDDAQVDGNVSAISARISATVTAVHVEDNMTVNLGDPLVELDPNDYQAALDQAEASEQSAVAQTKVEVPGVPITTVTNRTSISTSGDDVATAKAELAAAWREYQAALLQVKAAVANNRLAQVELGRSTRLVATEAVSRDDLDRRRAEADTRAADEAAARANAEASRHRVDQSKARLSQAMSRLQQIEKNAPKQLDISRATLAVRLANANAAKAEAEQARLNLSYTKIAAPVSGIVGKKSANVGDRVQPGQTLLGIVQVHDLWITANFKETQLAHMHPGQRVDVRVDAFGQTFRGHVESLPGASGARFSLLPPENATGNYVKVVQRLPVRIRLEPDQPGTERLRPGMSVEPKVWLR